MKNYNTFCKTFYASHFLLKTTENQRLAEGVLADTPLQQANNVFIGTVTIIWKMGAIPGGMDRVIVSQCAKPEMYHPMQEADSSSLMR